MLRPKLAIFKDKFFWVFLGQKDVMNVNNDAFFKSGQDFQVFIVNVAADSYYVRGIDE